MRRVAAESLGLGAVVAAGGAAWFGGGDAVCGADGAAFAWRVGQLQAWWAGSAPLAADGGIAVPVAGLPYVALGAALAPALGVAKAWLVAVAVAVGASAGVIWGLTRAAGANPLSASLAVTVGALPPVVASGLGHGGVDLAAAPFAALAIALLPSKRPAARLVGALAVIACGLCDARTGAIASLAALVAGGSGLALFAALLATGAGAAAASGTLDPVDLPAPFVTLRPESLAPGLAALAATLWAVEDRGLKLAASLGFVAALGPILSAFGDALTVSGAGVPLPAAMLAAFTPGGEGWGGGLVVAAAAAALGLGRLAAPKLALLLAPLALIEAARAAGPAPSCVIVDAPVAVRALSERTGGVLNLPVTATLGERRVGAAGGAHGLYLVQRRLHGRPLATGPDPLPASSALYAEPAVVLSLGADRLYLPPTRPGEALRGLGITEIVVHRRLFAPDALALLDPLLAKLYGAPQRDHAGEVDLYRVDADGSVRAPLAETLRPNDQPAPNGYLDLGRYLAGLNPAEGPAGPPLTGGPSASAGTGQPEGSSADAPAPPRPAGGFRPDAGDRDALSHAGAPPSAGWAEEGTGARPRGRARGGVGDRPPKGEAE